MMTAAATLGRRFPSADLNKQLPFQLAQVCDFVQEAVEAQVTHFLSLELLHPLKI